LQRAIGPFDATMLVMGGIVGAGIFRNPAVVAQRAPSDTAVLAAWIVGGVVALLGAFVYAELSALRPKSGGQYAFLSEGLHPLWGFLYAWALLFVIQTAATAAVAMTFASYLNQLLGLTLPEGLTAALAMVAITVVNLAGVRSGTRMQSALMVAKIVAIALLCVAGLAAAPAAVATSPQSVSALGFMTALVPVMFAYGGWQTACFVAGEVKDAPRTLPRALVWGVVAVIVLYLAVSFVCVRALGAAALAQSTAPAADVLRLAWGETGVKAVSAAVVLSTLGYISQAVLTAPRVIYAMAADRPQLSRLAWIDPRHGVPSLAIVTMTLISALIALSGSYGQILDYAIFADYAFFGLTALTVFALRRRSAARALVTIPGHPVTTVLFAVVCFAVSLSAAVAAPRNAAIGAAILALGAVVFFVLKVSPATGQDDAGQSSQDGLRR
jgi:APA family basic amino acid/polyamine antiporter